MNEERNRTHPQSAAELVAHSTNSACVISSLWSECLSCQPIFLSFALLYPSQTPIIRLLVWEGPLYELMSPS